MKSEEAKHFALRNNKGLFNSAGIDFKAGERKTTSVYSKKFI